MLISNADSDLPEAQERCVLPTVLLRELPISRVVLTRPVGSSATVATSAVPVHTLRMNVGSVRFVVCASPRPSATLIAGLLSCASSNCRRTRERRTADTCRLKGRRRLY